MPLRPNALTPAMRGLSPLAQGRFRVGITKGVPERSILGFRVVKCWFAGMTPRWSASTALTSPAIPAAASRCPRFVLTAPSAQTEPSLRGSPSTPASASTSMGSPSEVPVPCVST
nr:hypothetical protein [Sorangium cellulosum]